MIIWFYFIIRSHIFFIKNKEITYFEKSQADFFRIFRTVPEFTPYRRLDVLFINRLDEPSRQ